MDYEEACFSSTVLFAYLFRLCLLWLLELVGQILPNLQEFGALKQVIRHPATSMVKAAAAPHVSFHVNLW